MTKYPPITLGAVNALEEIVAQYADNGKEYLKEAPYNLEIKTKLQVIVTTLFTAKRETASQGFADVKDLTAEVEEIYSNLKNFKVGEEGALSATEQIQLLKLQTTLLERLLTARERATGVDEFIKFREVVLDFISATFDADQINELKARLESI